MFEYENDSISLCIQLNKSPVTRKSPDNFVETVSDEIQLDRILSRSDERVYTPNGVVTGKQIVIQRLEYHNPYVFLVAKIVPVKIADMIKMEYDLRWRMTLKNIEDNIEDMKISLSEKKTDDIKKIVNVARDEEIDEYNDIGSDIDNE